MITSLKRRVFFTSLDDPNKKISHYSYSITSIKRKMASNSSKFGFLTYRKKNGCRRAVDNQYLANYDTIYAQILPV